MTTRPPRGYRQNNPLNIRYVAANKWRGRVLDGEPGPYEEFTSMAEGYRAAAIILTKYFDRDGLSTPRQIVAKFAPAEDDNDVGAYLKTIERVSGFPADEELDLHDGAVMRRLLKGMATQEIGATWAAKTWAALDQGVKMAGLPRQAVPAAADPRILAPLGVGGVGLVEVIELAKTATSSGVLDWIAEKGTRAALVLAIVVVVGWLLLRAKAEREAEA